MINTIRDYIRSIDKLMVILCIVCSFLSIFLLSIITDTFPQEFGKRTVIVQIAATVLGIILMIGVSIFDYKIYTKLWFLHYPLCIIFVLSTFVFGIGRQGADDRAWIEIFGVNVQPAEFLKISTILTMAAHADKVKDNVNSFVGIVRLCAFGLLPCLLVVLQGDDGTAIVFFLIFACMMFAAGLNWKLIVAALGCAAIAIPLAWNFVFTSDQKLRFLVLFDDSVSPAVVYQQNAGLKALSSGHVWGNMLSGKSYNYVPEMHNDMIFSFVGNALGFFGCCMVVILLFTICVRILNSCKGVDEGMQGNVICAGLLGMVAFQTIINIGMNLKLLPVVGITLPFFSAGGSSVLSTYIAIGVALSVYRQNHIKTMY